MADRDEPGFCEVCAILTFHECDGCGVAVCDPVSGTDCGTTAGDPTALWCWACAEEQASGA